MTTINTDHLKSFCEAHGVSSLELAPLLIGYVHGLHFSTLRSLFTKSYYYGIVEGSKLREAIRKYLCVAPHLIRTDLPNSFRKSWKIENGPPGTFLKWEPGADRAQEAYDEYVLSGVNRWISD